MLPNQETRKKLKLLQAAVGINSTEQEYMIQINEDWAGTIKAEAPRFGFKLLDKIVSNVYLLREVLPESEKEKAIFDSVKNLEEFREFFKAHILHVERLEYATIKYYQKEASQEHSQPRTNWILKSRDNVQEGKCWPYYGMDVQEAWSLGYTGLGVRVAVVDNGVEVNHTDLKRNIDLKLSHNFVSQEHTDVHPLRFRNYIETEDITNHGTRVAGLIAGEIANEKCSAGVAFGVTLVALKVFQPENDPGVWNHFSFDFDFEHVPKALEYERNIIDIYSCSFNTYHRFRPASIAMKTVLKEGSEKGRDGKGNIFVFSAGNKNGPVYDCNTEALASSIYTMTIASVGHNGSKPSYAIPCAATLASTYGEFRTIKGERKLETTTHDNKCDDFTGTSASAALASGIFALTLQANPLLTWRDMQHVTILSASFERLQNTEQRKRNGIGLLYDPFFGFGLFNATAMIQLAKQWKTVPEQVIQKTMDFEYKRSENAIMLEFGSSSTPANCVNFIEHVIINLQYKTKREQSTDIILCSPVKTCSYLLNKRSKKVSNKLAVERNWNFTSLHFWGENPKGKWLLIFNETKQWRKRDRNREHQLNLKSAELILYGTSDQPSKIYDTFVRNLHQESSENLILSELYDHIVSKINELPRPDVDDVLDFVEETTKNPTNYWVGVILAIVFTLFLFILFIIYCTPFLFVSFIPNCFSYLRAIWLFMLDCIKKRFTTRETP